MDGEDSDEKIEKFFAEDDLRAKINRTFLGLEVRITLDHHLLKHSGATLVNQQGRSIDVHPNTVQRYYELRSLIYDYRKLYGKNPEIEAIRNKWSLPNQRYN